MARKHFFKITLVVLAGIFLLSLPGYAQQAKKVVNEKGVFLGGELIADKQTYLKAIEEGGLRHYTAHTLSQAKKMVEAFMNQFPEIKVEITRAAGATLNEKMLTEQAAGVLKADVVVNSDRNYLNDFYAKGWLRKNIPPSDAMYAEASKEAGYYYPTGASAIIMAYHTKLVSKEDAPKDWKDLGDPKWKGKLGGQQLTGGAMWSMVVFIRTQLKDGVDILESWGKNDPIMYTSGGGLANALTAGEFAVTNMGVYSSYPAKYNKGAPIEMVFPKSGFPLYIPVIGLMNQGQHPNAAKLFINWYLSAEGQILLSKIRGQWSLRDDVPPAPHLPPLSELENYWIPDPKLYLDPELRNKWIQEANKAFDWR
ncbi:MAG: extracellular solute-binding protein [Deltaproteobacteria bacterium]|nr:MAG: extracellular solute-binding protein [Deltaproteobacteria bacterium]